MLGAKSIHADECFKGNFIGADFSINFDLTNNLPDNWRDFNQKYIPEWLATHPGKSKVAAGLSCGALWTIAKGIQKGEIVLCPSGQGNYYIGEVIDNYSYKPNNILPHRRQVKWYPNTIERTAMSEALRNSSGSIGTVSDITKYADEIETLIGGTRPATIISTDTSVENASEFPLENI